MKQNSEQNRTNHLSLAATNTNTFDIYPTTQSLHVRNSLLAKSILANTSVARATHILQGLVQMPRNRRAPLQAPVRTTPQKLRAVAATLRGSLTEQYSTITDIAVVDNLRQHGRFSLTYHLSSPRLNNRLSVQIFANETTTIPSLAAPFFDGQAIFAAADWMERECWDMFGCYFHQHHDLRRILTDYGFSGHPLRKDFPLTGFIEVMYDDSVGRVVTSSVELAQEYRVFHLR